MYRLYGIDDWGSQVIHMALELSGAAYDYHRCDYDRGELKSPAFLMMNPFGRIPVLQTPDGIVYETAAILAYLEERHPGLAPRPGEAGRAPYLTLFALTTNSLHPLAMALLHPERPGGAAVQAIVGQTTRAALDGLLPHYDAAVGPAWFCPDRPTALSLYVIMLLRWVQNFAADPALNIPLVDYPGLLALARGHEAHPAVKAVLKAEGLAPDAFSQGA